MFDTPRPAYLLDTIRNPMRASTVRSVILEEAIVSVISLDGLHPLRIQGFRCVNRVNIDSILRSRLKKYPLVLQIAVQTGQVDLRVQIQVQSSIIVQVDETTQI